MPREAPPDRSQDAAFAERLQRTIRQLTEHDATLRATIAARPQATIEPRSSPTEMGAALSLFAARGALASSVLETQEELGRGGMGAVHRAQELLMGRSVAVKTLLPQMTDERHAVKLLREAWVTGVLEHPNIVPIYTIAQTEEGRPVIVMRHIEGERWSRLMHDEQQVRQRFGAHDLLEWNLRVLMHVCNAVDYAHSRGILHRDLKADNIMIGAFGQVYLVDWGVAACLERDPSGRLPSLEPDEGMVGTPRYMAPEMLGGHSQLQGPHTDVYLLGAILYQILHGTPPHRGGTLLEIVSSILTSRPRFSSEQPALQKICQQAMAAEPAERHASAEALRRAVEECLRQRGSTRLSMEARQRLDVFLAELRREGRRDMTQLYRLFGECRFGFRAALDSWAGNQDAAAGLRAAQTQLVEVHLQQGDLQSAQALLAEVAEPPAALCAKLERLKREQSAEEQRLEALRRVAEQHNPEVGRGTRVIFVLVMGLVWAASPYFSKLLGLQPPLEGFWNALQFDGAFLLILVVLGIVRRRQVFATAFNRSCYQTLVFLIVCQALVVVSGELLQLQPAQTTGLHFFLWTVILGMVSIFISARLWPSTLFYLAAFFWVVVQSEHRFLAMSLVNLFLMGNILLIWIPGRGAPPEVARPGSPS